MSFNIGGIVITDDKEWGCKHNRLPTSGNIKSCLITVNDLRCIAQKLTESVLDTSWMLSMDKGTKRSYSYTANDTAEALVAIFKKFQDSNEIGSEFGEIMISIGSSRALEIVFEHKTLPIAEIWKPQRKQNEGFDFHTECPENLINFGEAKYSGSINSHIKAIPQIERFINEEKHFRDRVHLKNLASAESINNLDDDNFGVIAAFSINSDNHESIMDNALNSICHSSLSKGATAIYLVGVICSA